MATPSDRDTLLGLWGALGLGDPEADIALDATITARTFAGGTKHAPKVAPIGLRRPPLGTLPRLSLATAGESNRVATATRVPDLTLVALIGEGGMGRIHRARQRSLDREVAVKTVRDEIEDEASLDALHYEAVVTGSLEHPGIIPVHALGCDEAGRPILVLDWGIATAVLGADQAKQAPLVGTPVYLAPEMILREVGPIDERTDVYLLGATLHEILTGRPRHEGASLTEVLLAAARSLPVEYPHGVSAELSAIASRATLRDPTGRHLPPSRSERQSPPICATRVLSRSAKRPSRASKSASAAPRDVAFAISKAPH